MPLHDVHQSGGQVHHQAAVVAVRKQELLAPEVTGSCPSLGARVWERTHVRSNKWILPKLGLDVTLGCIPAGRRSIIRIGHQTLRGPGPIIGIKSAEDGSIMLGGDTRTVNAWV